MNIEIYKENGAILFKYENYAYYSFPLNTVVLISNEVSDSVSVRLLGSRKNIITFNYDQVTNITAASPADLITKINEL